jgi:Tc5 transposase DNA-binding domain
MDRESRIRAVLEGLKSGQYKSVRAAAKAIDILYSTLAYRQKGGQANHEAHLDQQACTPEEEQALIEWIRRWHSQNFPIRHEMLRDMARHLILNRLDASRRNTISAHLTSHNWPARFIKRHPYLKGLITKLIDRTRINACIPETFKEWFDKYQMHFEKY